MKPINPTTLLEKSRNWRNIQEYYRLANIEANREWGLNGENGKLIEIKKLKVEKLSAGIFNLVRQLLP